MLEGLLVLRGYLSKGIKFSELRMPAEYSHGKAVGKEFARDGAMLGAQTREERLPEVQKGRWGLGDVSSQSDIENMAQFMEKDALRCGDFVPQNVRQKNVTDNSIVFEDIGPAESIIGLVPTVRQKYKHRSGSQNLVGEGKIFIQKLQQMFGGLGCNLRAFCRYELRLKLLLDQVELGLVLTQAFAPVPGSIKEQLAGSFAGTDIPEGVAGQEGIHRHLFPCLLKGVMKLPEVISGECRIFQKGN